MHISDLNCIKQRKEIIQADGVDPALIKAHDPIVVFGLTGRIPTYDHIRIGVFLSQHIAAHTQPLPIYYVLNHQPNPTGYDQSEPYTTSFKYPMISTTQRQAMLNLALAPYPQCISKEWEIKAGGMSYTLHTLAALQEIYPKNPLVFIAGDEYKQLHRWHKGLTLFQYTNIICINKSGNTRPLNQHIQHYLTQHTMSATTLPYTFTPVTEKRPGEALILSGATLGLSEYSTSYAVDCIQRGQIPPNLPSEVYEYVMKHHLLSA